MPSIFKQIEKLWKIVEKKHRKKIKIVSVYLPITQIKHNINTALMLVSEYCFIFKDTSGPFYIYTQTEREMGHVIWS